MTLDQILDKWKAVPVRMRGLALIAALTALLVGMAFNEHVKRLIGEEIVLSARLVDPRDILRGAFVQIDYDVENLAVSDLDEPPEITPGAVGEHVYLVVRKEGDVWKGAYVRSSRPRALPPGAVALRAKFLNRETWDAALSPGDATPATLMLNIGADRYFADEKRARELDKALREGDFKVVLAVGADGKASIKGLVINGKREDETFF